MKLVSIFSQRVHYIFYKYTKNEQEIRSLLQYFLQRVHYIFEFTSNIQKTSENMKLVSIFSQRVHYIFEFTSGYTKFYIKTDERFRLFIL